MNWSYAGNVELTCVDHYNQSWPLSAFPDADLERLRDHNLYGYRSGVADRQSDAATFMVTAVNDGPVVADIPDQTISEGLSFTTVSFGWLCHRHRQYRLRDDLDLRRAILSPNRLD